MVKIDKQSLREQVDKVKEKFNTLLSNGKVNPELELLFDSMLMIVDMLIAIFMEKTTKKTSKNSSIPPSQTNKDDTAKNKQE